MTKTEIQDQRKVWVAWTNTDRTEGKGMQFPLYVCSHKSTAIRRGKKGSVQGSNCNVTESIAIKINNQWLVPGEIISASDKDIKEQVENDAFDMAIQKARDAGMSKEDINLLLRKTK